MDWEKRDEVVGDAPLRAGDVLIGHQRFTAERAVEVEVVQPAVEAILVEHVAAG